MSDICRAHAFIVRQSNQPGQHQTQQHRYPKQAQSTASSLFALDIISAGARLPEIVDRDDQQHEDCDRANYARREGNVMKDGRTDLKAHSLTDWLNRSQARL